MPPRLPTAKVAKLPGASFSTHCVAAAREAEYPKLSTTEAAVALDLDTATRRAWELKTCRMSRPRSEARCHGSHRAKSALTLSGNPEGRKSDRSRTERDASPFETSPLV